MAFWTDKKLQAKRKYRFQLEIAKSQSLKFESYLITKVTRPSFSITDTTHSYLNHTFKFPGRLTWEDVSFTVVEPLVTGVADSTDLLMAMLYQSGYHIPSATDNATIAKNTAPMSIVKIKAIDGTGATVDTWNLFNAWISQASLGDFDYTADDLMGIDITLKYDYATYNKTNFNAAGSSPAESHQLANKAN